MASDKEVDLDVLLSEFATKNTQLSRLNRGKDRISRYKSVALVPISYQIPFQTWNHICRSAMHPDKERIQGKNRLSAYIKIGRPN